MANVQAELEEVIGKNKVVGESDISKLPYLQATVKETLRMHPPTVFLLPRKANNDVELYGYVVPKDAQIFVNLWAISRDPNHWTNPDLFSPERFLEREIDMKGQDFGLIPFGAGRRICPGDTLAFRMLNLMLGNLLHGFNWKVGDGIRPEDLDMSDSLELQYKRLYLYVPFQFLNKIGAISNDKIHAHPKWDIMYVKLSTIECILALMYSQMFNTRELLRPSLRQI